MNSRFLITAFYFIYAPMIMAQSDYFASGYCHLDTTLLVPVSEEELHSFTGKIQRSDVESRKFYSIIKHDAKRGLVRLVTLDCITDSVEFIDLFYPRNEFDFSGHEVRDIAANNEYIFVLFRSNIMKFNIEGRFINSLELNESCWDTILLNKGKKLALAFDYAYHPMSCVYSRGIQSLSYELDFANNPHFYKSGAAILSGLHPHKLFCSDENYIYFGLPEEPQIQCFNWNGELIQSFEFPVQNYIAFSTDVSNMESGIEVLSSLRQNGYYKATSLNFIGENLLLSAYNGLNRFEEYYLKLNKDSILLVNQYGIDDNSLKMYDPNLNQKIDKSEISFFAQSGYGAFCENTLIYMSIGANTFPWLADDKLSYWSGEDEYGEINIALSFHKFSYEPD